MNSARTVTAQELESLLQETFAQGESLKLTVTGYSMRPFLQHLEDQVELVSPDLRPPRGGEIILFRRTGGKWVLHRVRNQNPEGGFTVSGDAQLWTEQVAPNQVVGVVRAIHRKGNRTLSCDNPWYRLLVKGWYGLPGLRRTALALARIRTRLGRRKKGRKR